MAAFAERSAAIAAKYETAARSQNHHLFREAMVDHWRLATRDRGAANELAGVLRSEGRQLIGKPVTASSVDELVDLVSNLREDMTESQRLSVFMQELLAAPEAGAPASAGHAGALGRVSQQRSRTDYRAGDFDYVDVDLTPNRSLSAAAQGIIAVLLSALLLGGALYLLNQA